MADVGLLSDGRFALLVRRRAQSRLLAVDPFASPPVVTVEEGELGIAREPGFVRAAATALRGTVLTQVRARRGDRLLRLTFSTRSRFGVEDSAELFFELVPRFGNVVLVKREMVVAAAKEFSPADNGRRSVVVGQPYAPPPLPADTPQVPRLIAQTAMAREAFLGFAASDAPLTQPLYVYRHDGRLLQAHVVALDGFGDATCTREASLLDVFAELVRQQHEGLERNRLERLRIAVLKRLDQRERQVRAELASLDTRRKDAAQRDALRAEGESLFGTLHSLPPEQRGDAKERAAKLFARYRKLGAALPHVERRERELRAQSAALEALVWEAQRVAPEDLGELNAVVANLGRRVASRPAPSARRRKRQPFELRTEAGSRIVLGRSPSENAHVTFEVARPNDLWFHARGIPGAHVILARDGRDEPPPEDIAAAAELAAAHSKAKASAKVPVDYTLRKYVRKQRNAPPGLVWYTNQKTIVVPPKDEALTKAQPSLQ